MKFADLVEQRLIELGENINSFEARQGWPQGYLRVVVRKDDKRSIPKIDRAKEICDALGLELYIGPPRDLTCAPQVEIEGTAFSTVDRIEGAIAAGHGRINYDAPAIDRLAFSNDWLKQRSISAGDSFLVGVKGDSMAPHISDGDLVMIDTRKTQIMDGRVYALNDGDNGARIKRLEVIPDVGIILRSDNTTFAPEYRTGTDAASIDIIGQVVWSGHNWI